MQDYSPLFQEDLEKIESACAYYPLGSYQIGEIARLSGYLQEKGVNVLIELQKLCKIYEVETESREDDIL